MKLGLDIWQEIFSTIRQNKLRTFLTGFAVSWGIFMLIVLLGAGNGLINGFTANFADRATNSIRVSTWRTDRPYEGLQAGRSIDLENQDLDLTTKEFADYVVKAGGTLYQWGRVVSYGSEYVTCDMVGVYPSYTEIEPYKVLQGNGRFINDLDIKETRKVILIHPKTAETLFKNDNAIGKNVNVNGIVYQIIGIYEPDKTRNDQNVLAPFTTVQLIYNKGKKINHILFTTKNLETIEANEQFEKSYRRFMSGRHQFHPDDHSAMWIWNRFTDFLETLTAGKVITTAIWIIGIFTLLSGIVGVSNIMLITVKERTKEFGIRKAIGASPASILWLIILESIVITSFFGYIGMVAGIGVTEWASTIFDQTEQAQIADEMSFTIFKNPTVSIRIAIQATIVLIVSGTIAGFFPARKAVKIKPIDALRAD